MEPSILRIIDANLNRAREGLRVLEEYARLVLNDVSLTSRIKGVRHALAEVPDLLGADALVAARDIRNDVGTQVSTASEQSRTDAAHVAAAAAKRTSEALRAIEEYGKIVSPASAARVEQLRYELYALEQDVRLGGPRRVALRGALLHVLVTESLCRGPWLETCAQAIVGGADVIQLREKGLTDRELLARGRQLRTLTRQHGVLFIINDRPDIARLAEADGVHVGQDDLAAAEARRIVGMQAIVGTSTHSLDEARAALAGDADYLAVGPMFASGTKPRVPVQSPTLLAEVIPLADRPIVAIGGISVDTVGQLPVRAGVQAAVCQSVISAADPAAAAREIKSRLHGGSRG